MSKKKIGYFDLSEFVQNLLIYGLISFVGLLIILIFLIVPMKQELSQLPHKVCWNETIVGEYDYLKMAYIENTTFVITNTGNQTYNIIVEPYSVHKITTKKVCKWEGLE